MKTGIILILCVLECLQWTEARRLNLGQCDRRLPATKLLHGRYIDYGGKQRVYACNKGYVINTEADLEFRCVYQENNYNIISRTFPTLSAAEIKCEAKKRCRDPSPEGNGLELIDTKRYKLKRESKTFGDMKREGYYEGDEIEYRCKPGYRDTTSQPSSGKQLDTYYDFMSIYDDIDANETTTYSGVCDRGLWIGKDKELVQPVCTTIQCNASRFESIKYGYILNYTSTYGYLENMRLHCDPGYSPIGGRDSALCFDSGSFSEMSIPDFGCEETMCPAPGSPLNGYFECDNRFYSSGTNCTFSCNHGYALVGNSQWTCTEKGRWNQECVKCTSPDQYCESPCVPTGSEVASLKPAYFCGSQLIFTCSDQNFINGTITRTCMKNRKWSGSDIDCLGDQYFNGEAAIGLANSLENMRTMKDDASNITAIDDSIGVKKIDPNSDTCCDVYFLLDMSQSMEEKDFKDARKFIKILLPKIGISNTEESTSVALYLFAQHVVRKIDQHYPYKNLGEGFANYTEAEEVIDQLDREEIIAEVGESTDLSKALEKIQTSAETKHEARKTANIGLRDNVLILLSDGDYTGGGEPVEIANNLKEKLGFQIYSIAIGKTRKKINFKTMKGIASEDDPEEPTDKHFIAIDMKTLDDTIANMINKESEESTECGYTDERLTKIHTLNEPMYKQAEAYAWPWMVQLRTNTRGICGGSLIDRKWILTAAHCIEDNTITKVRFRSIFYDEKGGFDIEVSNDKMFKHDEYNRNVEPKHVFDVALIKLGQKVTLSKQLHTVCLWSNTSSEMGIHLDQLYESGKFGVVTGWGPRPGSDTKSNSMILKQLQIEIQDEETCRKVLSETHVDLTKMFCAGSPNPDSELYIDTCKGDSGGPFLVENPAKDDFYIQTGIVSAGNKCGQEGKYGFYTKLNKEILNWITKTMNYNKD